MSQSRKKKMRKCSCGKVLKKSSNPTKLLCHLCTRHIFASYTCHTFRAKATGAKRSAIYLAKRHCCESEGTYIITFIIIGLPILGTTLCVLKKWFCCYFPGRATGYEHFGLLHVYVGRHEIDRNKCMEICSNHHSGLVMKVAPLALWIWFAIELAQLR